MSTTLRRLLLPWSLLLTVVNCAFVHAPGVWAHESRPAYLEINETVPGRYDVLWRTPLLAGIRLPVFLKFPDNVRTIIEPSLHELPDSLVERRVIDAGSDGLTGKRIEFTGLQATITDVLVRVNYGNGERSTTLIHPSQAWVDITAARGVIAVSGAYLRHGVEHILFSYDHLLFVFALLLIVRKRRFLLITITAFTIAHSITLVLATLGMVHVPRQPVEAAIALSILLLAVEIVRLQRNEGSLTAQWPWVVAFSFGLLHGFGFASAPCRYRAAARRYSARAVHVQRRRRTRTTRIRFHSTGGARHSNQAFVGSHARAIRPSRRSLCHRDLGFILVLRAVGRIRKLIPLRCGSRTRRRKHTDRFGNVTTNGRQRAAVGCDERVVALPLDRLLHR